MYAISSDLDVDMPNATPPKGYRQAHRDVERTLAPHGFGRVQQSMFTSAAGDIGRSYQAVTALKALAWVPQAVTDIRVFRVEDGSDVTHTFKGGR